MKSVPVLAIIAVASGVFAQSDQEKIDLKRQIEELKREQKAMQDKFDKRIDELEKKIAEKAKKESEPSKVKTEVLSQFRYDFDSGANDSAYARRLELKFSGQVNPRVSWVVMIDPAKSLKQDASGNVDQSSRMLQDATISYKLGQAWSVDVGQKKIPFSMEALQRTSELDILERTLFLAQGRYGDVRDQGVWVNYKQGELEATAAVTNGAGESQNQKDLNEQKSFGGRVVYRPSAVQGLQVGAAAISGQAPSNFKRERLGLEAGYRSGKWAVLSEIAAALTDGVRGRGWYAHAGYKLHPAWEAVLRYDTFDPNLQAQGDDTNDWILGVNHFLQGHEAKIQFNYVSRRLGSGARRSLWQLGWQTRW